jgi:hypothetical protein
MFPTRKQAHEFMMTCNALERTKKRVARGSGGEYINVRYVLVDMQADTDDATSGKNGSDDDDDDVPASGGGKKVEDGDKPKKKRRRIMRCWV